MGEGKGGKAKKTAYHYSLGKGPVLTESMSSSTWMGQSPRQMEHWLAFELNVCVL